jgi:N-acetylmuramoyl-L-alanine amidase
MFTVILDPGHGGIINGKYVTAGKRSPVWADGTQLFEGVYNRHVCSALEVLLWNGKIPSFRVVDGEHDTPLGQRVLRANEFYKKDKKCIYVSIHGNAGPETASGFEVFTSIGQTKSDILASFVIDAMEEIIPNVKWRKDLTDGDEDKEENFYVLRSTFMPAILSENGFFTNYAECHRMMDQSFINLVAQSHYQGIVKYINSQKPQNESVDRA